MGVSLFGHKGRYSKATMMRWSKEELIEYIQCCEYNEKVAYETLEQQARNFESMLNNLKNYEKPIKIKATTSKLEDYIAELDKLIKDKKLEIDAKERSGIYKSEDVFAVIGLYRAKQLAESFLNSEKKVSE